MAVADEARLRALFERPGLVRLCDRLRHRFERGLQSTQVTLANASEDERREIAGLLGRAPGRGRSVSIAVDELEAVLLRGGLAPSLRAALEATGGPLRDLGAERLAGDQAWQTVFREAQAVASRTAPA